MVEHMFKAPHDVVEAARKAIGQRKQLRQVFQREAATGTRFGYKSGNKIRPGVMR